MMRRCCWITFERRSRRARRWRIVAGSAVFIVAAGVFAAAQIVSTVQADEPRAAAGKPGAFQQLAEPPASTGYEVRRGADGWTLMTPQGDEFFSLGVSVFSPGTTREAYDAERPSYAAWRHYPSTVEWADASLRRLKTWGFTTLGGWFDHRAIADSKEATLHLAPVLSLGAKTGMPWLDMWDEQRLAELDALATRAIAPFRDDPRVLGYYSDNELGWWNAELWRLTLEHDSASGQRRRLLGLLRREYQNKWDRLRVDFSPPAGVNGWDDLDRGGVLQLRSGGTGVAVMRKFLAMAAERYYQVMRDAIRRQDPDALYLGDRYQSFYYPETAQAAGEFVDVISTNLSAHWNGGGFLRCYLDALHRLSGKPILVSEFYMSAEENRSGNRNTNRGFPVVATQRERAVAAARSLEALIEHPAVVGAEWFQYYDEPPHGRFDGEDFNFGLVDIDDRPYEELTTALAQAAAKRSRHSSSLRPDATLGVPPAPAAPMASLDYFTGLDNWDRERGYVPCRHEAPLADLYLCWSREALYLGLYGIDPVERSYFPSEPDGQAPEADRAEWQIAVNDRPTATIRLGSGRPAVVDDESLAVTSYSGLDHRVRLIAVAQIPSGKLGCEKLTAGTQIRLKTRLTTFGKAYRYEWVGQFNLEK